MTSGPDAAHARLVAAEAAVAARTPPGDERPPVARCSVGWHRIEVEVIDELDEPVGELELELRHDERGRLRACTDAEGLAWFEGLEEARYTLRLPELDEHAWSLVDELELAVTDRPVTTASWQSCAASDARSIEHVVEPGECIASLGHRFGVLPDELWSDPENASLRGSRRDGHVLQPGDRIHVRPRGTGSLEVRTDRRYRLRRHGVPEVLRLRVLEADGRPRANTPYVLALVTGSGTPLPSRTGTTDAEGTIVQPIAPDAARGEITLGRGDTRLRLPVELGRLLPEVGVAGIQLRLVNLGYLRGTCHGTLDRRTQRAVAAFQSDAGLPTTGTIDGPTTAALVARHGS